MASSAVNRPTDPKTRDKDITGKLQVYGIYSAFANGKVPSNQQIDVAMNSALKSHSLQPSKRLSPEGQSLVRDLREVIEQAKMLLLSKNDGNLLQDFIWQTQHLGSNNAGKPQSSLDKATAQQHGNEALEGLRTLGQLVITNGEFRKLLKDSSILFRDIAGDAAQKTANKVNPNEEDLAQIDKPAEDNTWHDAPDLSRERFRNQVKAPAQKVANEAQDAVPNQERPDNKEDAKQGAKAGLTNAKDKIHANMSEDQKQKAREYRERGQNYLKEKMPKERRDQMIWRLKKMVVEIQSHSDYQQAIDTLLRLAEEYQGHAKDMTAQAKGSAKDVRGQGPLQQAEGDLKTILERFANGTSFDDAIDSINQIYRDADRDPELKGWFKNIDAYIRKVLKQQGYILEDKATEEWNELYDKGHYLFRERYRDHTDRISDEFRYIAEQFDHDPQNKAFAQSMQKLFDNLGHDENGQQTFKPHLVKDLTGVIIPRMFENIQYVPIPRIEYSDPMVDAIVENLVIEGDNLAPNAVEFGSDNYWKWGRKNVSSLNKNNVMISVSGIQMDLRDVNYYLKKKQGFPGVTDKGIMDIFLGGSGLSFKIALETADNKMGKGMTGDNAHFFKIKSVVVDIQNMDIKLKQSNHKLLFNIFKPLLFKIVKPVISKVVEKQIRDQVSALDEKCYRAKKEADAAAESAKRNPDPDNVQSIYQRYFTAFQNQMTKAQEKKEQAKEKTADTKVNVAMTMHDSIFPNIAMPGAVSTQATKFQDQARQGDKWTSPVFSIGSASPSSNIKGTNVGRRTGGKSTGTSGLAAAGAGAGVAGAGAAGYGASRGIEQNQQPSGNYHPGYEHATEDTRGMQDANGFQKTSDYSSELHWATGGVPGNTTLGEGNPVLRGAV